MNGTPENWTGESPDAYCPHLSSHKTTLFFSLPRTSGKQLPQLQTKLAKIPTLHEEKVR